MEMEALASKFIDLYGINLEENGGLFILNQCIKKISEEYPKYIKDFVTTVEDQTTYIIPETIETEVEGEIQIVDRGLIKVSHVYYTRNSGLDSPYAGMGGSISSQFTEICERAIRNKMNPVDACITDNNTFDLIPTPTESGNKVYFEYEAYRSLEEIPLIFEDLIFRLYFYYERELEFRKSMRNNSGNVFQFDRTGNIKSGQAGAEDPVKTRENEMKSIVKDIRNTVMKLGR